MTLHPLLFSALSRAQQGIFHFRTVVALSAFALVTPASAMPAFGTTLAGALAAGTPVLGHLSPVDTLTPAPLPDAAALRALFGAAADSVVGPSDSAAFLVQIPQSVDLEEVIAFGKTLIGRPYRSGSKGPNGFDCSGLMHYIFGQHGILMPSSSRDYAERGSPVPYGQWEVGDFVLFGGRGGRSIGHVGLVVAIEPGAVYMLHSGTSPGVCVQNFLAMPYYKKRYVGARRLF